jgi:DNA polymerase/3'-5' exonuclease PolX
MEYLKAKLIAEKYGNILLPFCERCEIAGSIRREAPEVHDIEIVCLPRNITLFEFVDAVNRLPKKKGEPTGRYTQRLLPEGINLDLFMPQPHDYFRQFTIRTGSADYSAKVIAQGWVRKGWRGTENGLRLNRECININGRWICKVKNPTLPPIWQSEEEFFTWLGLKWIEPSLRYV